MRCILRGAVENNEAVPAVTRNVLRNTLKIYTSKNFNVLISINCYVI